MSIKNKLLARYLLWKYRADARDVARCQEEIFSLGTHPHFGLYRKEEMLYWLHVPHLLRELNSVHPIKKCLDIGSAYGTLALFCKQQFHCDVYCIDFVDHFLSPQLIEKHNFNFSLCNIELDEIPWDEQYDIILLTEVLEHFNFYPVQTLRKIKSRMTRGGKLFLTTPDALEWGTIDKYYSSCDQLPEPDKTADIVDDHVYLFNKNELLTIFRDSGLHVDQLLYSPGAGKQHFIAQLSAK